MSKKPTMEEAMQVAQQAMSLTRKQRDALAKMLTMKSQAEDARKNWTPAVLTGGATSASVTRAALDKITLT